MYSAFVVTLMTDWAILLPVANHRLGLELLLSGLLASLVLCPAMHATAKPVSYYFQPVRLPEIPRVE